jgi:hypothetical protein
MGLLLPWRMRVLRNIGKSRAPEAEARLSASAAGSASRNLASKTPAVAAISSAVP